MPAIGHGTLLKRGDGGSPEAFNSIPRIKDITSIDTSVNMVDVTTMSSPNGIKEQIPGLKENGSLSFEMVRVAGDTEQQGIKADLDGNVLRNFQLELSDTPAVVYQFAAYIESYSESFPVEDTNMISFSLKPQGVFTVS